MGRGVGRRIFNLAKYLKAAQAQRALPLIYLSLDIGQITHAMKSSVIDYNATARRRSRGDQHLESEGNVMKMFAVALAAGLLLAPAGATVANAQTVRSELRDHPRILQAIRDIEDAIGYMEAAPNNFGGHKAAAIQASREAVRQLREAAEFRAEQDRR
jgi:hypothetical protein